MTNSILVNKKMWILGIVAITVVLIGFGISYARGVVDQNAIIMTTSEVHNQITSINGSISVGQAVKNFIGNNVKVSFLQASEIAGKQIANSTMVGGHLGIVQGYLVYTFYAANTENQTGQIIIVDAGNGKVLYTSQDQSLFGQCPWAKYGFGAFHRGPFGSWNTYGYGNGMWQQNSSWGMHQW